MIITNHGIQCFKMQFGNVVIATNPPAKDSKAVQKTPKFGADIVLQSLNHPDFNGGENMFYGEKEPYVVTGPGEYEVKDIIMRGFQTSSDYDGEKGINTIYSLTFEGMHVVFLGAISEKELPKDVLESIDEVDILFVPIAGEGLLEASEAYKLAVKLNPRLIIPMHYGDEKDKALQTFLKEGGVENLKIEDKITLKRRDLDGMEGDIAVLKIQ